ncbi:MAG: hypothetical protein HZB38_08680 [Planctomycetes bacterium]|nr:hypothetical protein [Planctomycetota bacterium]
MSKPDPAIRSIQAGIAAWLIPGAGHWLLGLRGLAWLYFIAVSGPFWVGMLIGGVKASVDPQGNWWLFLAELGTGGYTAVCYMIAALLPTVPVYVETPYVSYFPSQDLSQIYLSVAGLLNLIVVFDAIARSQTDGLPVFHHEQLARQAQQTPPPTTSETTP